MEHLSHNLFKWLHSRMTPKLLSTAQMKGTEVRTLSAAVHVIVLVC